MYYVMAIIKYYFDISNMFICIYVHIQEKRVWKDITKCIVGISWYCSMNDFILNCSFKLLKEAFHCFSSPWLEWFQQSHLVVIFYFNASINFDEFRYD